MYVRYSRTLHTVHSAVQTIPWQITSILPVNTEQPLNALRFLYVLIYNALIVCFCYLAAPCIFCQMYVVYASNIHHLYVPRCSRCRYGPAYATGLRPSVCCLSVTLCIVPKQCVLEQKLLLTAYMKSHIGNRLVPK